jgi:hypothetical protein
MYLQLRIFNPEYSTERICAAVGDMPMFACVLYCKFCAKYRAHPPVCAIWTVVPDIYYAFTAPHIQTSMFIWTYLRCYWRYLDNSLVVYCKLGAKYSAHPPVCAMWTVVPDIYNAFTAPYIQTSIFIWKNLPCYCTYLGKSMRVILHSWCQIQRTSSSLRYATCGPGHIQSIIPHHIFRLQYSAVGICAAIVHITTIQFPLYCKLVAKYSAHPPVYAMWPVVPAIYKVFSAPRI